MAAIFGNARFQMLRLNDLLQQAHAFSSSFQPLLRSL